MIEAIAVAVSAKDHQRGPETALVTLVEYGDFACPRCMEAYPVVQQLLVYYRTCLRFVFRHNPRYAPETGAVVGACGAEAAALQGSFWPMHDLLYERRAPITEPQLEDYAKALGLDLVTFMKDLHSRQVLERVREDEVGGLRGGVIGTPTFFVNGLHFRDKLDLDSLSRSIGAALLRSRGVHSRTW